MVAPNVNDRHPLACISGNVLNLGPCPAGAFSQIHSPLKSAFRRLHPPSEDLSNQTAASPLKERKVAPLTPLSRKKIYPDGKCYNGQLVDGQPHGWGKVEDENGKLICDGEWHKGKMHGSGKFIESDGITCYEGRWVNGQRSGYGRQVQSDGVVYEGDWLADEPHGNGKLMNPAGNVIYEGEWVKGKKEGKGILRGSSGEFYVGQWSNNQRNGKGVERGLYVTLDGEWKNGLMHGDGKISCNDGDVIYQGEFVEGKKQGVGFMRFSTGETYQGEWLDDQFYGQGVFTTSDGIPLSGTWRIENEEGFANVTYPIGDAVKFEFSLRTLIGKGMTVVEFRINKKTVDLNKFLSID